LVQPPGTLILKTFLDNLMPYYEAYRLNEHQFSRDNLDNLKSIVEAIKKRDDKLARKAIIEHLRLGTSDMERAGVR
jgi:DNA-binding GntR family transcriptional regulator